MGYIEPVLNPVWVFLVLGERPSHWALLGGGIIIIAVVVHMLAEATREEASGIATVGISSWLVAEHFVNWKTKDRLCAKY